VFSQGLDLLLEYDSYDITRVIDRPGQKLLQDDKRARMALLLDWQVNPYTSLDDKR